MTRSQTSKTSTKDRRAALVSEWDASDDWWKLGHDGATPTNRQSQVAALPGSPARLGGGGRASEAHYRNLFTNSPIPTMEQDYSKVLEWMEHLRALGVRDLEAFLRSELDRLRYGISLIDQVAANPAAVEVTGVAEVEIVGPIDPGVLNEGAIPVWVAQFEAVWWGRPFVEMAYEGARWDGSVYDALLTMSVPEESGRLDYRRVVVTIMDVSAQRAEERRIAELLLAKNRFLAQVSHELRTPLTGIVGFVEILRERALAMGDEEFLSFIDLIDQQATDVSNIVEDLLVGARAELGTLRIERVPLDVDIEIGRVIEAAGKAMGRIEFPDPGDRPRLAWGDPARLRQILRNLISNALRYGGPTVKVEVWMGEEIVGISVLDDGAGLPMNQWERIFDPYVTVHSSAAQPGSIGIGLAISRELAELMGGTLSYEYRDGWSAFHLFLQPAPAISDR